MRRWFSEHQDAIGVWMLTALFWLQVVALIYLVVTMPRGGSVVPGQTDMLSAYPDTPKSPKGYPEPMVCLWRHDAKIVYCRTEAGGRLLVILSRDGGETYEEIPSDGLPKFTEINESQE